MHCSHTWYKASHSVLTTQTPCTLAQALGSPAFQSIDEEVKGQGGMLLTQDPA